MVEKASALMTVGRTDEALAQMDKAIGILPDAELIRGFSILFSVAAEDWERTARDLTWAARRVASPEVAEATGAAVLDPESREAVLRRWQAGEVAAPGEAELSVAAFGRPELRMAATKLLDGGEASLDVLDAAARGPYRDQVYGPVIPAILGPELSRSERTGQLIRQAYTSRQ